MSKKTTKTKTPDYEQLGRMLENIYLSGYIDQNKAYKTSFLKGIVAGLGGAIGATLILALLLWILTLFDQIPLVGQLTQLIQSTIESNK